VKRRLFLGGAAAGVGLLAYAGWVEPEALTLSWHGVRLSGSGAEPFAPDAQPPAGSGAPRLRIVQLSDLHLKRIGSFHDALARAVDALDPDLLVFTGDTVDDRGNLGLARDFVSLLATDAPRIAVMGNWEYQGGVSAEAFGAEFRRAGGELLVNRSLTLELRGGALLLTGLDDWLAGAPDPVRALEGADADLRRRGHHLVLAHCPVQRDAFTGTAALPWLLSGHTHGGQVGVPGLRFTPRGSGDYERGWYRGALPHLYVSRGLGTSVVPLRVGSPPEVAVFDVELE